ncbi:hypothetical protein, partial [Neisseria gonorrhoeae]|uniref:hypothetical protein n=1 Tax=Neisseria gonorrhoeae TaxID=485 RepID=UPI001E51F016
EGILRMVAIFPNTFAAQIQALRLVALSPALSHRERGRVGCWGLRFAARKTGCAGCFFAFQTTFLNAQFS